MKKILSILGTSTLIGTSTTSLVACDNTEYTLEELTKLKEENSKIINGNKLEWIASQEKPFKQSDNKWYFVVWRDNKGRDWRIAKFKNDINLNTHARKRNLDNSNNLSGNNLNLTNSGIKGINLNIYKSGIVAFSHWWEKKSDNYFKSVYRWNGNGEPKTPIIDPKTGEVTNREGLNNI